MKVTAEMKIKDVLMINERMIDAFVWLAPEFERLRNPTLRRLMSGRVTVSQAARVGHVPLSEALYVLNLVAGEDIQQLHHELEELPAQACQYTPDNPPRKPRELVGLDDTDPRVRFVDVMPRLSAIRTRAPRSCTASRNCKAGRRCCWCAIPLTRSRSETCLRGVGLRVGRESDDPLNGISISIGLARGLSPSPMPRSRSLISSAPWPPGRKGIIRS